MNIWLKRALIAVPLLVALFFGAILLYVNVIREDAPDELDAEDLSEIVSGTTTPEETGVVTTLATTLAAVETAATEPSATDASSAATAVTPSTAAAASTGGFDGTWAATTESVFGYRIKENLFGVDTEGVGRGSDITGELVIAGTTVESGSFTVDVASIVSDDERRDGQFRGRIMEIDTFPGATFVLTEPIELSAVPEAGATVTATAIGDLTLHGVTQPVSFEVTAEAGTDRFGVLGNIPVVFADYDIQNPSRSGITTEDNGLLEFVLVFERA